MQKVADKLASVKNLKYTYNLELNYASEGYLHKTSSDGFLDLRPVDSGVGFRYQFSGDDLLAIYNGVEKFIADKKEKTITVENNPPVRSFGSSASLYYSPLTLKNVLPKIIADKTIQKKVTAIKIAGVDHYVLEFALNKQSMDALGEIYALKTDRKSVYRLTVNKRTLLPVEIYVGNDQNQDFARSSFVGIREAADEPESPAFAAQRERFETACTTLASLGITARARHAANSAALLRDERVWYDFVRPGLLLYGIVPPPLSATLTLRPALSLHSRIVHVKGLRPGEGTGYGLKSVVNRPSTIAVVPAGYADGLDRRLAGNGYMLVRGRRAPIVGSVCMDMTMIDVTGTEVAPGDEVVIIGQQGNESLDVREIAASVGTIPYELLCRVGARIERVYS